MIAELTYRPVTDDDLLLIEVATGMIRPLSIIETEIAEARVAFEQMLTERPELRLMIAKQREA